MPPISAFDFNKFNARRLRIYASYVLHNIDTGRVLDPPLFKEFVERLRKLLKLPVAREGALRDSLFEYTGIELTEEVYARIAVKIASGYDEIRAGRPVLPSNSLPAGGLWFPIEVAEMRFDAVVNEKSYVKMTALILAGALAGRMFTQSMPAKSVSTFFATSLGWPKWGARPAHSELVLMLFTGRVVGDPRRGIQVDEYRCTASQLKRNKKMRAVRDEPCLKDCRYQCKTCPIGYSKCPRGTHRYTWVTRLCPSCKDERAIFDPAELNAQVCLLCRSRPARGAWADERRSVT